LVLSVSFNSKTLGFLYLLLLFIFTSSPSTFNNKNPRKISEENEENNVFELKLTERTKMCNEEKLRYQNKSNFN